MRSYAHHRNKREWVVEGDQPRSMILPISVVLILDNLSDIGSIAIWHPFRYHKQQSVSE